MLKQKQYDWKDTNMALFGSDLEKKIKAAAAEGEPQWVGAGKKEGIQIWRIVNFRVTAWPKKKYGQFHEGDSYIILNTYLKPDDEESGAANSEKLAYDVHFWIGEFSTQDEYGTAAYKTVELDHLLGDVAVQHREVMGHESELFLSYFQPPKGKGLQLLEGGADSGFTHVEVNAGSEAPATLWWVKGVKDKLVLRQVKVSRSNMNSGDVFILDVGNKVWTWTGHSANNFEKLKAGEFVRALQGDRGGRLEAAIVQDGVDDDEEHTPEFCKYLPTKKSVALGMVTVSLDVNSSQKGGKDEEVKPFAPTLLVVQGTKFSKVAVDGDGTTTSAGGNGRIPNAHLKTVGVYVLDTGFHVYVWVGSGAAANSRSNAMSTAHAYINANKRPCILPVTRVAEGHENAHFNSFFDKNATLPAEGCSCVIM